MEKRKIDNDKTEASSLYVCSNMYECKINKKNKNNNNKRKTKKLMQNA